jgi:hypothetical protein
MRFWRRDDVQRATQHRRVVTIVLPTVDGKILKIRKATTPGPVHKEIYATPKTGHETSTQ